MLERRSHCWASEKRTLSLSEILKNLPLDGNYVNLQYGSVEDDISKAEQETGRKIINFAEVDPLKEIDNQFAIISNLDHVITVQGKRSIIHSNYRVAFCSA